MLKWELRGTDLTAFRSSLTQSSLWGLYGEPSASEKSVCTAIPNNVSLSSLRERAGWREAQRRVEPPGQAEQEGLPSAVPGAALSRRLTSLAQCRELQRACNCKLAKRISFCKPGEQWETRFFYGQLRTTGEGLEGRFGSQATPKKALWILDGKTTNQKVGSSNPPGRATPFN